MIFKSGCHNKQLTFGRLISLCKNINRAGGQSIRQPATFFNVRVQTGSDWGYFWGYLRKLNEYNSLKINWMFSDVMFLVSHLNQIVTLHSSKSRSQTMAANIAIGCTISRHRFVPQRS